MFFKRSLFLLILSFLLLFSCSEKGSSSGPKSNNPRSEASITLGRTPSPRMNSGEAFQVLDLRFTQSAAPLEQVGKEVAEGITLAPEMAGRWVWESDHNLMFYPEQDWMPGQQYKVKIDKSILSDQVDMRNQDTSFNVRGLVLNHSESQFYIDPNDPAVKRVLFQLNFNYPVDLEDIKERASLKVANFGKSDSGFSKEEYSMTASISADQRTIFFQSESLPVPYDQVEMNFELSKGFRSTLGGAPYDKNINLTASVPGSSNYVKIQRSDFTVVRNDQYEFDQLIAFSTKGESSNEDIKAYLEIFSLPVNRPEEPGIEAKRNFQWRSTDITETVLGKALPVDFTLQPTPKEYSSSHSLLVNVEPGRYLYFRIKEGAPFYGHYKLTRSYDSVLYVSAYPRTMELMGEGTILSMSGSKKLTLITQGVENVYVSLYRVRQDQLNHLMTQTRGDLKNLSFYSSRFNEQNISEVFSSQLNLGHVSDEETLFSSIDLSSYMHDQGAQRNGFFFLKIRDAQGRVSQINRFVMITDLGILVKKNQDQSSDLFVQSVSTASPVPYTAVEVLGKNGVAVFKGSTDSQGHLAIPNLQGYQNEKEPVVITVKKGYDLSFLPYDSESRRLSYSNFDTGGEWGRNNPGTLRAYLFSDRGIYRPGDLFHIAMIVRSGDWKASLNRTPIRVKISNPRGEQVYEEDLFLDSMGLQEIQYQTTESDPTGNYQVSLYLRNKHEGLVGLGSTSVEVKEFLPDRLQIQSKILGDSNQGWISPEDLKVQVSLKNLFGTPAVGNEIKTDLQVSPAYLFFSRYQDYFFSDPFRTSKNYVDELGSRNTDENGLAVFPIDLSQFDAGSYRVITQSIGFEKGSGRNVSSSTSSIVSPNPYLVGWKSESDLSYIYKNADIFVDLLAVNPQLEMIDVKGLSLNLYEEKYISVLTRQPNDTYKYQSVKNQELLQEEVYSITSAGSRLALATGQPGDYVYEIKDQDDQVLARFSYSVIGQGNLMGRLDTNSELQIKLNKESYAPGETIEVFVKAPYEGSGLITIERDHVVSYKWFSTSNNTALERITVPSDMEGNGYINVTFIRAADSDRIYMSPLSYGAEPFSISRDARINDIVLHIPEKVKPGDTLEIAYETELPGKILIYGADKGILQVAHYQTPDPLSTFMKKGALEVKTFQILDLILPDFTMVARENPFGGGGGYDDMLQANLNPFKRKRDKPVVFWSGFLDNPGGSGSFSYQVPEYFNGTLQLYAVAVNEGALGVVTDSTFVRDDFIIMPNAPLFSTPKDKITVTATVANNIMDQEESQVTLSLETSAHLEILGEAAQVQTIQAGRDGLFSFDIQVKDLLGSGDLNFTVRGAGKESHRSISLSVRPAMPYFVRIQTDILKDGKDRELDLFNDQYSEFQQKSLSASYLPLSLTSGLQTYLEHFPYGCTEQITSQTIPYITLYRLDDLAMDPLAARQIVNRTLRVIMSRQRPDGAVGYWDSHSRIVIDYAIYSLHMVLEAQEQGFNVPEIILERGKSFLWDVARNRFESGTSLLDRAYAAYVLTRMDEITTNELIQIKEELEKLDNWKTHDALPFLAGSFKLLKMDDEAGKIIRNIQWSSLEAFRKSYNYYLYNCQYMYIVARHFPEELGNLNRFIPNIVETLQEGRYNTYTSAWTVLAFSEMMKNRPEITAKAFEVSQIDGSGQSRSVELEGAYLFKASIDNSSKEVAIDNQNSLNLYYQLTEAGFDNLLPQESISQGIEVYSEIKLDGKTVNTLNVGDQATLEVSFRTVDDLESLKDVAVVVLLPGGCDVSASLRPGSRNGDIEYVDVREDRVIFYSTLKKDRSSFSIPIEAVNKGSFLIPPLFAQSMYELEYYGYSKARTLEIED